MLVLQIGDNLVLTSETLPEGTELFLIVKPLHLNKSVDELEALIRKEGVAFKELASV